MRVIRPIIITDSNLSSTSLAEDDYSEWSAGTYNQGDRVIKTSTHLIYEAQSTTTDDPEVGVDADPPTWLEIGATRPWRMFDGIISSQSEDTMDIVVSFEPGVVVSSVAAFNLKGITDVLIEMTDPTEGLVYSNSVDLSDNSGVADWYTYFFEPISIATEFIDLELPQYGAATTTLTFTVDPVGGGSIGELIIGSVVSLGIANHGTSVQLLDFSRKERDEFGNFNIVSRRTSKLVNFDVTVETARVGYVFNQLNKLTTTPCVWVGTDDYNDSTLIYGYYRDFRIDINEPSISDCTLEIEGLV